MSETLFYIVSLKHTKRTDPFVTLWREDCAGYAWPLPWAGAYTAADIQVHVISDDSNIAVPKRLVEELSSVSRPGQIESEDIYPVIRNTARNIAILKAAALATPRVPQFDLLAHIERQRAFSLRAFGPGERTEGVCDHIRKKLVEIETDPATEEWVDVMLLAIDGAWRAGASPEHITDMLANKLRRNESRTWPDWRTVDTTKAF
jgi:hypothetical protein